MPADYQPSSLADTVEIAPGVHMPRLGLGTYKSGEGPDVEGAIAEALELGYRLIDTAAVYANETGVGRALRASDLVREDVFVTTKLWNSDQGYESALKAFDVSLAKLDMEYVDLYLVHWPWPEHARDTWRAMEQLLVSGRTRAIGVCNHLPHHLAELAEFATTMPAVNQCEFHPHLQQPELQAACRELGIGAE
jgi:methylglyoxal/glyoxal reductase